MFCKITFLYIQNLFMELGHANKIIFNYARIISLKHFLAVLKFKRIFNYKEKSRNSFKIM